LDESLTVSARSLVLGTPHLRYHRSPTVKVGEARREDQRLLTTEGLGVVCPSLASASIYRALMAFVATMSV
jgi:hypothetical protein